MHAGNPTQLRHAISIRGVNHQTECQDDCKFERQRLPNERQLQKVGQLRARIAADLHDEIGSNMGAVVLNSDLLKTSESLSDSEREQVADIHRVAQNTAQAIREISWFINPDFDFSDEMIVRMKEIAGRRQADSTLQ